MTSEVVVDDSVHGLPIDDCGEKNSINKDQGWNYWKNDSDEKINKVMVTNLAIRLYLGVVGTTFCFGHLDLASKGGPSSQ